MSLSINDYLNGTYQSRWTSNTEKSEQKDSAAETGKTKQYAATASLDQTNLGEDGIAVSEVSRLKGAEQSTSQKQSAAPRMDTVEISAEGKAASSTEDYAYEMEDLSEYTDSELKQMYYKGEITLQEYEAETGEALE